MKRLLLSSMILGLASMLAIGATTAYFSDTEVSSANTFTAGTLDLKIDGGDTDVVKFTLANLRPGNQPVNHYTLRNSGSLTGSLSISSITLATAENTLTEPEQSAGDSTTVEGELDDVLNVRIYVDNDKDGYYSTGDNMFYDGKVKDLPSSFNEAQVNKSLAANEEAVVRFLFDWWDTTIDNQAQNDAFTLGLAFTLEQ